MIASNVARSNKMIGYQP